MLNCYSIFITIFKIFSSLNGQSLYTIKPKIKIVTESSIIIKIAKLKIRLKKKKINITKSQQKVILHL